MRLFLSILAAMAGSTLGAAARTAADAADRLVRNEPMAEGPVTVNGSVTAAVVGGFLGTLLGGPRRAFWLGAMLGAAGADRFDAMLLSRFGLDANTLMAKATAAAGRARAMASERAGADAAE
jgi:hypothetical protein